MNAEHSAQLRLLDLQAADTALAQLAHRRRALPEIARLAERDAQAAALGNDIIDAETQASDSAGEQRRLENEVDAVRARAARDEQRMQSGGLPAKEIEGLQHEVATLARRQSNLEDDLLDVMEQREQADSAVTRLHAQRTTLDAERAELASVRDAAFGEIDASATTRTGERATIANQLPADLLALYER
ncbi:MAG: zinc ribbon domain-containing protein, partial [Jatrophihabitantaceae bacterium]